MGLTDIITKALYESKYVVSAPGIRGVDFEELKSIIELIRCNELCVYKYEFNQIYKYNKNTIEFDRTWQKHNCYKYCSECDCFLPDINRDEIYCKRIRSIELKNKDNRNYPEYEEWRKSVFERDNYTCQKCNVRGGDLEAHHINSYKEYPDLRLDINNGITLCKKCHKDEHHA